MGVRLPVAAGSLRVGPYTVEGQSHHYLFRVHRLRVGSSLVLFDGAGAEADARVREVSGDRAVLEVAAPRRVQTAARCQLTLMPALIKGERMDLCVQKLVELGVAAIVPMQTARAVVKLSPERAARRHQRYRDIATDAARQSGRAELPTIHAVTDFARALAWPALAPSAPDEASPPPSPNPAEASGGDAPAALKLIAAVDPDSQPLAALLRAPLPARACVAVGPEGGFTPAERARARAAGFTAVSLGPNILRAETAAIAIAAGFLLAPGQADAGGDQRRDDDRQ
ncbi:MAG: 16S rRNA (uracil(1498)-N(3))-methyltransferase [Haliangiales bacterium]